MNSKLVIAFLNEEAVQQYLVNQNEKLADFYITDPTEYIILHRSLRSINRTDKELTSMSDEMLLKTIQAVEHLEKGLKSLRKKLCWMCDESNKKKFTLLTGLLTVLNRGLEELYQVQSVRDIQKYELRRSVCWGLSQDSKHPWP